MDGDRLKGKDYEYNDIGRLEFEGDYLDNMRWNGIVKQYNWEDNQKLFEENIVEGNKI